MTVQNTSNQTAAWSRASPFVSGAIALALLPLTACFPPSSTSSDPTPTPLDQKTSGEDVADPELSKVSPSIEPASTPQELSTGDSKDDNSSIPQELTATDEDPILPVLPTIPIATLPNTPDVDPLAVSDPQSDDPQSKATENFGLLASGTFRSGEHPTQGAVMVLDDEGTPIVYFDDEFQTAAGPDLVLVLHVSNDVLGGTSPPAYALQEGDYVEIAPLKANQGEQKYSIPAAIILENYNSIAIWCRTFNATFGSASLSLDKQ